MADGDIDDNLDPDLDAAVADESTFTPLPGPITHRRATVVFALGSVAVVPFVALAFTRGDTVQLLMLLVLAGVLLVAAGLAASRAGD
jgi:hypothetical protein